MSGSGRSAGDRVRQMAERAPQAVAVDCFERRWSYGLLTERAARLASVLADLGVGPDKRLGLLLPPCPTAVAATLAGLRLGAAVVPCDPMAQRDVLAARLRDVEAGILVTLDLTRLQHRLLAAIDSTAIEGVLVERMAELLPFPKNVLAPLMRGGEIAQLPQDPRWHALPRRLAHAAAYERQETAGGEVIDPDGRSVDATRIASGAADLAAGSGEGCWLFAHPVTSAWALSALLAPVTAGRETVICPRLDADTVASAVARSSPQVAVLSPDLARGLAGRAERFAHLPHALVPPATPDSDRAALARATGAHVQAWAGPCASA